MNITFEADETVKVVQVVIVNDEISERTEEFAVVIMPVEGVFPVEVVESRSEVIIEILDNDREFVNHLLHVKGFLGKVFQGGH